MVKSALRTPMSRVIVCAMVHGLIVPCVLAAPGDVNSVNDNPVVTGGTYYNTHDSSTVFTNTGFDGTLTLPASATVRAFETTGTTPGTAAAGMTGHGGNVVFYAPNSVVRLDGTVDVSAAMNGGIPLGNGGTVSVQSSFLYANGNIIANGLNGGSVQFSVGSLLLGPLARIIARGTRVSGADGAGGVFYTLASDAVKISKGAIIDVQGRYVGSFNSNLISIEGSIVNVQGILNANGVLSQGGAVSLVADFPLDHTPQLPNELHAAIFSDILPDLQAQVADIDFSKQNTLTIGPRAQLLANGSSGNDAAFNPNAGGNNRVGDGGVVILRGLSQLDIQGDENYSALVSVRGGHASGGLNGGHGGVAYAIADQIDFSGRIHAQGGNGYLSEFDSDDYLPGGVGGNGGRIFMVYPQLFNNHYISTLNRFTKLTNQKLDEHFAQINASGGHNGVGNDDPAINTDDPLNAFGGQVVFAGPRNPVTQGIGSPVEARNVLVYRGLSADKQNVDVNRFGTVAVFDKKDPAIVAQLESVNTNFKQPLAKLKIVGLNEFTFPSTPFSASTVTAAPALAPSTNSTDINPPVAAFALAQTDMILDPNSFGGPTNTSALNTPYNPSLTQQTLNVALIEFKQDRLSGQSENTAFAQMLNALSLKGVKPETATQFLQGIDQQQYTADDIVIEALKQLASLPPED